MKSVQCNELFGGIAHKNRAIFQLNLRLYCLRKVKRVSVNSRIWQLCFHYTITIVFTYCIVFWCRNVAQQDINIINGISKNVGSIILMLILTFVFATKTTTNSSVHFGRP